MSANHPILKLLRIETVCKVDYDITPEDVDLGPGSDWHNGNPEESQKYLDAYENGEWCFYIVYLQAVVEVHSPTYGFIDCINVQTDTCGAIDAPDEAAAIELYDGEPSTLHGMLRSLGISDEDIQAATTGN